MKHLIFMHKPISLYRDLCAHTTRNWCSSTSLSTTGRVENTKTEEDRELRRLNMREIMGAHAVKDEPSKNVVPQFLELLTKKK
jgi:hypothetical protein